MERIYHVFGFEVRSTRLKHNLLQTLFLVTFVCVDIILLPSNPVFAAYLGAAIGTLTYVKLWDLPRTVGLTRIISSLITIGLFHLVGGLDMLIESVGRM